MNKLSAGQSSAIVATWVVSLLAFYLVAGYFACGRVYRDKAEALERHAARVNTYATEKGRTQVDVEALKTKDTGNHSEVSVGLYVDRILEISTKATGWTVEFYVWFRWKDSAIDPGETFQVVDGEIHSKMKVDEFIGNEGRYALYKVIARMTKFFNVVRYPLDNHLLTIRIEDADHPWDVLRYVPDDRSTEYSSRVVVPGYQLGTAKLVSKPHAYRNNRGDPRQRADQQVVFSQAAFGIEIARPDWGLYIKMFQGLFAAVAIAVVAFLFGPLSSDRISLGIGAFFAAVANSYINMSELPQVGVMTLTDMANGLGMVTILLTLFGSIISARIAKDDSEHATAVKFDRASLLIFSVGFVLVNVSMALAAAV